MYAKVFGSAINGLKGAIITVEIDITQGLPSFEIVGLPATSIKEARERVRAALKNSGFDFPMRRIVVNLAPADLRKDGAGLDLAIAMGIIIASGQLRLGRGKEGSILLQNLCKSHLFIGELSLEGQLRPIKGILAMALDVFTENSDISNICTGIDNGREAKTTKKGYIISVASLSQLIAVLQGKEKVPFIEELSRPKINREKDFQDVRGQFMAKRGMEICAAGFHNIMLVGPPGSGKSMLAERLSTIMPPLSDSEVLEVSRIYSVAGLLEEGRLLYNRPFRKPHHTITMVGMAGGGVPPKPGEITLAHHGILMLDETPEFKRPVLEVLRQPLEEGAIHLRRGQSIYDYPADFLLILSMNPCPCGYLGDKEHPCTCTRNDINNYRRRLSGPLLDRIDLSVTLQRPNYEDLHDFSKTACESSEDIYKRIQEARKRQIKRFQGYSYTYNGRMTHKEVELFCKVTTSGQSLLEQCFKRYHLSARTYDRILKVSRTIADLDASDYIEKEHIAEALAYRSMSCDVC